MKFFRITIETVTQLSDKLLTFFERHKRFFKTKTHDVSHHAETELKGALLMNHNRTYKEVSRKIVSPSDDGQNIQHFMSDSPWETQPIFDDIQLQIKEMPQLHGGMLNIDESGDECSSDQKVGSQKQYLGRLGKVETGQVAVLSSYYKDRLWAMTDAQLFMPEDWFSVERKKLWEKLHIPADMVFKTKIDLAKELINRAIKNQLPFTTVGADTFYGRDSSFRDSVAQHGKIYMCSVPCDTKVYLHEPQIAVPIKMPNTKGAACKHEQVIGQIELKVSDLAPVQHYELIEVRESERGTLVYNHAFLQVWTTREVQRTDTEGNKYKGLESVPELLIIRIENTCKFSYALTNASINIGKQLLTQWRSDRYFVERTNQDLKTEAGWDELRSAKYRAYMHRLTIDALALWFVAQCKIEIRQNESDNQDVKEQLGVKVLPDISFANIRELLLTIFPLQTLSQVQAVDLVNLHLLNRAKSIKSRTKELKI